MKNVSVVIGANYGDEGKGLITDHLASHSPETMVVRFNGGCQAGHTVVTPKMSGARPSRRHVFHHFGAGTFTGAPTFLSQFFATCPIFFLREYDDLLRLGVEPECHIDPRAVVTTPYDIMLNQAVEKKRGDARHGSCGMGFNETWERNKHTEFSLYVMDLFDDGRRESKLRAIRKDYLPMRAKELGIEEPMQFSADNNILDRFSSECDAMLRRSRQTTWPMLEKPENVVFEGAQGLLLDQEYGDFPHVTRSNTGMQNVAALLNVVGFEGEARAYYVSRTYLTRHGAGPFPGEMPYTRKNLVCKTNVDNEHQGKLRYGVLHRKSLVERIKTDVARGASASLFTTVPHFALTCVDQTGPEVVFVDDEYMTSLPPEAFVRETMQMIGGTHGAMSFGETRMDVAEVCL